MIDIGVRSIGLGQGGDRREGMEGERARLSLGNEGREGKRIERWDSTHDDGGELFVVEPFVRSRGFVRLSIKVR